MSAGTGAGHGQQRERRRDWVQAGSRAAIRQLRANTRTFMGAGSQIRAQETTWKTGRGERRGPLECAVLA